VATTLTSFRSRIRERVDLQGDNFVTDAATSLDQWINDSITELYDLLVGASDDWYLTSQNVTVSNGQSTFAVPTGMVRWRGLERDQGGGQLWPVPRGQWNERWQYISDLRYVITGATVRLFPPTLAPGSYVAWYVPVPTALVSAGDSFDGINGWEEYVVLDCAIKCRGKGEDDADPMMIAKAAMLKRIQTMAGNRDGGEPQRIIDVQNDFASWPWLP
jgi:hypothetical protein